MSFTDFQKDCIQKAKDQLHLIPRIDHVIRWKDMPGKVSAIVRLQKSSAVSIAEFSEELKISKKALTNFTKGKDHSGKEWNELLILVNPDQFKAKQGKVVKDKAEVTVSDKILAILNRDVVKDRGLRDETIKTELRPIKARFISSVLNKLLAKQKIERFIGESKKVMWKIPVDDVVVESKPEEVVPQIISSNEPNPTVIEFPNQSEVKESDKKEIALKEAWKLVLENLKIEDITSISEEFEVVIIRAPLKGSPVDFPYSQWRKDLEDATFYIPKFCPHLVDLRRSVFWDDDLAFLKAIRKTMGSKFKTEQSVVDHFNALLELGNSKVS